MFSYLHVSPSPSNVDDVSLMIGFVETTLPWLSLGFRLLPYLLPGLCQVVSTLWTFALGLEREMTVGESLYLHLLICMLLLFCTGFICKPRRSKTLHEGFPTDSPPAPNWQYPRYPIRPFSWRCTRSKYRRQMNHHRNPRQYYLMHRACRRPVQRPVRDPPRRFTHPWTWKWNRRVRTDWMRHESIHETKRKTQTLA
jgi:hypothetical protein